MKKKNTKINGKHSTLCKMEILLHPDLGPYDVCVYLYMRFRFQYFFSEGKDFFESHDVMSNELKISKRKLSDCIKKLVRLDLITSTKRSVEGLGQTSNTYTVVDVVEQSQGVVKDFDPPF